VGNDLLDAMHETACGLYKAGILDTAIMRELDSLCLMSGSSKAGSTASPLAENGSITPAHTGITGDRRPQSPK